MKKLKWIFDIVRKINPNIPLKWAKTYDTPIVFDTPLLFDLDKKLKELKNCVVI